MLSFTRLIAVMGDGNDDPCPSVHEPVGCRARDDVAEDELVEHGKRFPGGAESGGADWDCHTEHYRTHREKDPHRCRIAHTAATILWCESPVFGKAEAGKVGRNIMDFRRSGLWRASPEVLAAKAANSIDQNRELPHNAAVVRSRMRPESGKVADTGQDQEVTESRIAPGTKLESNRTTTKGDLSV